MHQHEWCSLLKASASGPQIPKTLVGTQKGKEQDMLPAAPLGSYLELQYSHSIWPTVINCVLPSERARIASSGSCNQRWSKKTDEVH